MNLNMIRAYGTLTVETAGFIPEMNLRVIRSVVPIGTCGFAGI